MEIVIFIWEKSLISRSSLKNTRRHGSQGYYYYCLAKVDDTHTHPHTCTHIYTIALRTLTAAALGLLVAGVTSFACALIILFSTGFIRKLSATLSAPRRTLDIYLCKNVKSFVKLVRLPPFPFLPDLTNKAKRIYARKKRTYASLTTNWMCGQKTRQWPRHKKRVHESSFCVWSNNNNNYNISNRKCAKKGHKTLAPSAALRHTQLHIANCSSCNTTAAAAASFSG